MNVVQFKAWLEGFTEGQIEDTPNKKQWKTILAKLETVDVGPAVPATIFTDFDPQWPRVLGQPRYDPLIPSTLPFTTCQVGTA